MSRMNFNYQTVLAVRINDRLFIHVALMKNRISFFFFPAITHNALINVSVMLPPTLELVFLWKRNFSVGLV